MKKIIISTFPPRKCGIGIYTQHLVDEVKDAEVISLKEHKYSDSRVRGMIDSSLGSLAKTAEYIKKRGYKEVLIQHEYAFYNLLFFPLFLLDLKLKGVKTTIEMHTIAAYNDPFKKNIFRAYNLALFMLCDRIIVHSKYAKKNLPGSRLFRKKIEVIPLAIPHSKILPMKKGKILNILCFGFIWHDKGTDLAVKAFGSAPDIKLKIVGSINPSATEKQREFFSKVKRLASVHKNITVMDKFVSEKEKMKLYREADFIVLPYRMISQSAVLTEIWSIGKIPIASDLPPLKEEIGNNEHGILFRSGDAQDLKKATIAIANDKRKQGEIIKNMNSLRKKRSFAEIAKKVWEKQ